MLNKLMRRQQGFTLLELLIVIVIIGILAVIIVPGLVSGPRRARDATRKADLRSIKNALETYHTDEGEYPVGDDAADLTAALVPDYISGGVPTDPGSTSYDYQSLEADGTTACTAAPCEKYTLTATLENTTDADYPTYTVDSQN